MVKDLLKVTEGHVGDCDHLKELVNASKEVKCVRSYFEQRVVT